MAGLIDKIKSSLFGAKITDTVDNELDRTLNTISRKLLNKDSLNSVDLMKDLMSKNNLSMLDAGVNSDFFRGLASTSLLLYDNKNRIYRYINAEEICDAIPYCAKALKVLTDQIISPDDITKKIIQIIEYSGFGNDETDDIRFVRQINEQLDLDDHMYELVYDTLKYGDQFVEICDVYSSEVPITQTLLTEDANYIEENEKITLSVPSFVLNESGVYESVISEKKVTVEILIEKEDEDDKLLTKKKNVVDLSNVRLIIHDPAYVIKIQSNRFKLCLGYLIIPKPDSGTFGGSSSVTNLGGPAGSMASQNLKMTNIYQNYTGTATNDDFFSGINQIYKQIITRLKKHLLSRKDEFKHDDDISLNKNEIINILSKVLKDVEEHDSFLRIRYVPPERMEHFEIYNKRFFPYGESIFYKSTFQGKLLIALETALTVKRLSDSTEKRIVYVESGTISRNVRSVIEMLKEEFNKKKYSLDSFGSIGSIPSFINTYENYYIPQRNGKRYAEFDTLAPAINIRDISDELKFFRDQLVASLDVPPSFVSLEENSVTKANLAQESNIFARTVISYQAAFSKCLQRLFSKIYKFCKKEKMPDIRITLSPPKQLQTELYAEFLDVVLRISNSYNELGIPKEHVVKELLPLEWEKIEHVKVEKALENKLKMSSEKEFSGEEEGNAF